jgi:hypothetical protein
MIPKSILNNRFMTPKIYSYIIENQHNFLEETVRFGHNSITLLSMRPINPSYIQSAKDIYTNTEGFANKSNDTIKCYIYLTDFKKSLDLEKDNISSAECNTASTTFFVADEYVEVVLWRHEEWRKVLYHELIHAFAIDYRLRLNSGYETRLVEAFPHYNRSIREAYTEVLATLLSNPASLRDETIFLGSIVNKIIYFMSCPREALVELGNNSKVDINNKQGIEYIGKFFKSPNRLLDPSTNTSSYYILKSIYLWNCIYIDGSLLDISNLTNKTYVNANFYRVLLEALESGEYIKWLQSIYFKPTDTSLRLTYKSL